MPSWNTGGCSGKIPLPVNGCLGIGLIRGILMPSVCASWSGRFLPCSAISIEVSVNFVALPESFYKPSAAIVAPRLLGHLLVRNTPAGPCGGAIVETEAYVRGDPACHGFIGKTARNRALYGPPG